MKFFTTCRGQWIAVALAWAGSSVSAVARTPGYPPRFLWGAAFSAHQTEGAFDGGENGDWYVFEHGKNAVGKPNVAHGDTADIAIDHWHRYSEDLEEGRKLGLNTIRTSLAWEKIEPAPGVFSTKAILHYRAELQRMHELGLRPMLALHHFTHPLWFAERGGWLDPKSPELFLGYASYVVSQLGDLCDLWITFNEPMITVSEGYLSGITPPLHASVKDGFEAAFNLGRAHRMVAAMIHQKQGPSPHGMGPDGYLRGVGLANALAIYDPADPRSRKDRAAARVVAEFSNWGFIRGVLAGEMKLTSPSASSDAQAYDRKMPSEDLRDFVEPGPALDWIGVNYYMRWLIRYDPTSHAQISWRTPPGPVTDNGWSIYPEGLARIIQETHKRFKLPLIVTENGLADAADTKRPDFIRAHLRALDSVASNARYDVRGYYHWSLLDNFEWLSGYQYRFGLVEIRYDQDLRRVPRASASVYADEIRKRADPHL